MEQNLQLHCPCSHKSPLESISRGYICTRKFCAHSNPNFCFLNNNGVPVIISESLTDTVCVERHNAAYVYRHKSVFSFISEFLIGDSKVTKRNCKDFVNLIKLTTDRPRVLVVGGGTIGSGTKALYEDDTIEIVSFDIYPSKHTDVICDAHYMPFASNSFDGVWVQAVLEHVVDPNLVVQEIHRVLNVGGVVYAETPFMQHVHEGAYDFNRYTVLGHRYLFKNFQEIKIGGNQGPDVVLSWSLKYFFWALFRSKKLARFVGIISLLLLRPFAPFLDKRFLFDASSGVYFLGIKPLQPECVSHKELVSLYFGAQKNPMI